MSIHLYVCFMDIMKKAYDSIAREVLLEVLGRFGVPTNMLRITSNFHDDKRARVRTDNCEHSEWFDVTQGLRQGCAL